MAKSEGWVVRRRNGITRISHNGKEVMARYMNIETHEDGQSYMTLCLRLDEEDVIDTLFSEDEVELERQDKELYMHNPGIGNSIWSLGSSLDSAVYWSADREMGIVELFDIVVEKSSFDTDISFGMIQDSVRRLVQAGFLWKV